jgi:transcription elongation factor S-II
MRETVLRHCVELIHDERIATDLEIGIFNWSLQQADYFRIPKTWSNVKFCAIYDAKAKSILANMDEESYIGNKGLLTNLRSNLIIPHDVAFMKPQELFPERWREVVDLKVQKDEYATTVKPVAMTDQFRCKRCKKRECVYQELQLRSADEPATIIITCISCSNTWRVG